MNVFTWAVAADVVVIGSAWVSRRLLVAGWSTVQARLWTGNNLAGRWKATYEKGGQHLEEQAILRQVFHWVTGRIENRNIPKEPLRVYKVRGKLTGQVLVATYAAEERGIIDCGGFTLAVGSESKEMRGRYSWMDSTTQAPDCGGYVWRKETPRS